MNKRELVEEICEMAGVDDDYKGNGHLKRFQLQAIHDTLKAYEEGDSSGN